jgi:hypothetical protein
MRALYVLRRCAAVLVALAVAPAVASGQAGGSPGETGAAERCGSTAKAGAPHTITPGVGARQSTVVGSAFPIPLAVTVTDAERNPVPGVLVTFSAPGSGASGRFTVRSHGSHRRRGRASQRRTVAVRTGACGIAVAPPFTANGIAGGYVVKADAGPARPAAFALVNETR